MLSGGLYALAIPLILDAINPPSGGLSYLDGNVGYFLGFKINQGPLAAFFALFCLVILITRAASAILAARISLELSSNLRQRLCKGIVQSSYPRLEEIGQARLMVAVTDDVRRIIGGAEAVPQLMINTVMLISLLGFLWYINAHVFIFVLEAVVFGVLTFHVPMLFATNYFRRARDLYDTLQKGVNGLILGVKELQLDQQKRNEYFDKILSPCERELLKVEKRAISTISAANSYGDLLFFMVIGVIAFIFVNYHQVSATDLTAVVMVLLYITAPIALIINSLPKISMAIVSLRKVKSTLGELPERIDVERPTCHRAWDTINFVGASYRHSGGKTQDGFFVGPLDFTIRKGEITFIVGGNGSGKSTLCKMLSLHYPPSAGDVRFDGKIVDTECIEDYRQNIATVFSDYFLFDRLLGPINDEKLVLARHYLQALAIDHKVQIEGGIFSTTDLSDGQRKRLALVVAFIDDKELYLLDEWAADQDPEFKRVFYMNILPELRARGKAVVVVSHDDRYFHIADQILIMEDGKIVERRYSDGAPVERLMVAVATATVSE
nr:cyclic peptide export ABC transporter [Pelomonas sp. P7]